MKKIYKTIVFSLILTLFSIMIFNQNNFNVVAYTNSVSEIIMDVNSGRVLFENNAYEKKYMASTTKILTAICIIENCNISDVITVTDKTVGVEGSSIYLEVGEKLSVKDLLYGLMLRSGNDCAETLAVYCSGSIEKFSLLMNETAKKIGALNSNFVNPHGLHNDNHYTTAYDLALISRYAMKNQDFRSIVATKAVKIPFTTKNYDRYLTNKNKMLKEFDGANGIKTGYTKKAGRCLVSSCLRNGLELICVVLNCPPMFERSKSLLTQSFENYKNYKVVESDNIIDFVKVKNRDKTCGIYIKNDIIIPLKESEYLNLEVQYDYEQQLSAPIKKDSEVGFVKIYVQNKLIFKEKIYTIIDIE